MFNECNIELKNVKIFLKINKLKKIKNNKYIFYNKKYIYI